MPSNAGSLGGVGGSVCESGVAGSGSFDLSLGAPGDVGGDPFPGLASPLLLESGVGLSVGCESRLGRGLSLGAPSNGVVGVGRGGCWPLRRVRCSLLLSGLP